jgi:hypothetical protein
MACKPQITHDGANRLTNLNEGYVRKGGQNPPPQNFTRPDPPPAFKPSSNSGSGSQQPSNPSRPES